MIRLVVRTSDRGAAANVGGPVDTAYNTVLIESAELESLLRISSVNSYANAEVIGAEIVKEATHE